MTKTKKLISALKKVVKISAANYVQDANGSETDNPNRAETFGSKEEADKWIKKMFGTSTKMVSVPHPDDDEDEDECDYIILIEE